MQHAIGYITVRAVYRYIIHIGHIVFDADYFVCWIFFEEPAMARKILIQVFAFADKAKTNLLCENACRCPANPDIGPTTTREYAVVQQQNLQCLADIIAESR